MADKFGTVKSQQWRTKAARKDLNIGAVKARTLNIEDTNVAALGSDLDKKVKLEASKYEHQWDDAGKTAGLQIWRIEDFKVQDWPKEEYGHFFAGDSYILLHTYKRPGKVMLLHDIFFWLGKNTSQDEAGTAAYKTVELDERLGSRAVQHREIQDYESPSFKSLFKDGSLQVFEGGVASGFNHVGPVSYETRLLQCKGVSPVLCRQVELKRSSLNSGDVFILDTGLKIYQMNGKDSRPAERAEAAKIARAYDDERGGEVEILVAEEGDADKARDMIPFWTALGGEGEIKPAAEGGRDEDSTRDDHRAIYRVSDAGGAMSFTQALKGADCTRPNWLSQKDRGSDVWVFDTGYQIWVWIGAGSEKAERQHGVKYGRRRHLPMPAGLPPCQRASPAASAVPPPMLPGARARKCMYHAPGCRDLPGACAVACGPPLLTSPSPLLFSQVRPGVCQGAQCPCGLPHRPRARACGERSLRGGISHL